MEFSPPRVIFLLLLLEVALVSKLRGVAAKATMPSSSSYQQSTLSGAEGRWAAAEEFSGPPPAESSSGREHVGDHSWWDDDDDDVESDDGEPSRSASPSTPIEEGDAAPPRTRGRRSRARKNGRGEEGGEGPASSPVGDAPSAASSTSPTKGIPSDDGPSKSEYDEEHPMRTDEWLLEVRLSRLFPRAEGGMFPECRVGGTGRTKRATGDGYRKRQVVQFARNGYVKVLEEGGKGTVKRKKPRVGKWRLGHSGVAFDIPVQVNVRRKGGKGSGDDEMLPRMTVLHYHADIHLNKFGERPRMFRGVITRDRHSSFLPPSFLRPVIGTFSAEGIGHDTADTSYRERAISLSRQQVINERREVQ